MFDDARKLPNGSKLEADLLIIGSGAAGTTIASEFAGSGVRVIVVESGGLSYDSTTQKLYRGVNAGHLYEPLDLCRVRTFGGSTDARGWGGWCKPLSKIDFEFRNWVPLSGWPISRADLDPYYRRALKSLGLPPDIERHTEPATHGTDVLKLDGPDVINEPCPLSPAPQLGQVKREMLASATDVRVLLYANVTEIIADADAKHIYGAKIATLSGQSHTVTARFVVLAAGGIENARLLLLSDQAQSNGLGNGSDFVGRCFMEHPRFAWGRLSGENVSALLPQYDPGYVVGQRAAGTADASRRVLLGASIALSETAQRSEEVLGARSWILPAPEAAETGGGREIKELVFWLKKKRIPSDLKRRSAAILADLPNAGAAVHAHLAAKFRPPRQWQFVTVLEQEPSRDSRVTLDTCRDQLGQRRVRLDWRLGPLTRKTLQRSVDLFAAEMQKIGLQCAIDGRNGGAGPDIDSPRWVWHHMGTTRMSASPRDGVVDSDCKVHGIENLFIAGSSVFPTSGNDMPTLTVVALAHRLADNLKKRLTTAAPSECLSLPSRAELAVTA